MTKDKRFPLVIGMAVVSAVISFSSGASAQSLFGASASYQLDFSSISVAIGDFNRDGNLDFAVAGAPFGAAKDDLEMFLGNGDGTFSIGSSYSVGGQFGGYYLAIGVTTGDFNNDGILDLATTATGGVYVLLGNGDGTFQTPIYHAETSDLRYLVVGDFNNDGNLDLAIDVPSIGVGGSQGGVKVLLGNGYGSFQDSGEYSASDLVYSLADGDMDGDSRLDLVTANMSTRNVSVMLGNGDGTFQPAVNYAAGTSAPISVALADLNGDGILDVVVGGGYQPDYAGLKPREGELI